MSVSGFEMRRNLVAAIAAIVGLPAVGGAGVITTDQYCTLEEAIISANTDTAGPFCVAGDGPDRVVLTRDARTTGPANPSVRYALLVTSEILIDGRGYTIQRHDLEDPDDYRLFQIDSTGDLTLEDVTLVAGVGAPVAGNSGVLRLKRCRVVNTTSTIGAIINAHILWVDDCFFQNNGSTFEYGGAITTGVDCRVGLCQTYVDKSVFERNSAHGRGGGIYNGTEGYLSVNRTTFYLNDAANGGGAIFNKEGFATVANSTFLVNKVTGTSSVHAGGAIYNDGGSVQVKNSTFSENQAGGPGAITTYAGVAPELDGTTTIQQSTFYGNVATSVIAESSTIGGYPNSTTTIEGSIVAGGVGGPDCDAEVTNSGNNFGCGGPAVTNLQTWLSWWGGYAAMHALRDGSNAIDAGGSCGLPKDERGIDRDDPCEAGAFEFGLCEDRADNAAAYDTTEIVEACQYLWTHGEVLAPDGNPTLRAGKAVILGNGFTVEAGTAMTVELDASLLP